ncbi:hypothetical protein HN011_000413, partial [Eciton burchellii]
MTVSNLMTVISLVAIGTMFVTCTALPGGKRRMKVSGHKPSFEQYSELNYQAESRPVLYHPLSDYDIVQSSLDSTFHEKQSFLNFASRKKIIIENLKLSVTFRDNMLYIFAYLLHGRENGLTEEQYTSLQMLYDVLRKKMVPMYNMLSILSKLQNRDKSYQTRLIFMSLSKNLPSYLQCTATFLAQEIQLGRLDISALIPSPGPIGTFNYFTNINPSMIHSSELQFFSSVEYTRYDSFSNSTHRYLGSLYVRLLHEVYSSGILMPQELFGLILINLPNPKGDPILEEHIRYVYDMTKNNLIVNWDSICQGIIHQDIYTTISYGLSGILGSANVDITMKKAVIYIYNHLKPVSPTHANPYFEYTYNLVKMDIDVGLLLSAIVPQEFDTETIRMKDRLLLYFMHNYKNKELDHIMAGFNKYIYEDPLDLLIAFLTRITDRAPVAAHDILEPATALLPALIMKKYMRRFTPFVSSEIDILILLESLKNPDINPTFSWVADSTIQELILHPQSSLLLNNLIPTDKGKCITPKQCLTTIMMEVPKIQINIPTALIKIIQNIVHILKLSVPHQPSYPISGIEMHETQTPIIIEVGHVPTYLPQPAVPHMWNMHEYIGEANAMRENLPSPTLEWQENYSPIHGIMDSREKQSFASSHQSFASSHQSLASSHQSERQFHLSEKPATMNISLATTTSFVPFRQQIQIAKQKKPYDIMNIIQETAPTDTSEISGGVHVSGGGGVHVSGGGGEIRRSTIPVIFTTRRPRIHGKFESKFNIKNQYERLNVQKISVIPTRKPMQSHKITMIQKMPVVMSSESSESVEMVKIQHSTRRPKTKFSAIKQTAQVIKSSMIEKTREKVPMLPPSIKPDQPLVVQLSNSGVPVVMSNNSASISGSISSGLVLPGITELLKTPNMENLFENAPEPIVEEVLQPLSVIFGKNYIRNILKDVDSNVYPTNIALLLALFKKVKNLPQMTQNPELSSLIRKYISTIEYISPMILLPIVTSLKHLTSTVVYSTFNPHDTTECYINNSPPEDGSMNTVTIPLVNPNTWLESINPINPYEGLIPDLPENEPFAVTLRPLKSIMTIKRITELLGPDFQPLAYPNKGALLITLLHKLRTTKEIQSNQFLKVLIDNYILAIELPSMHTQISKDSLMNIMSESKGHWQPELTSLISALPSPKNRQEITMIELIESFFSDHNILKKLHIEIPSSSMSRGEFLFKIIQNILSAGMHLDAQLLNAFRYYRNRVEFTDMGALPIMWVWVEVYVVQAHVQLGKMIQQTLDFNKLTYKEKLAYNDVISYLAENSHLLQDNQDFDFENYKTQGEFVKALFRYIMRKPQVSKKIKKHIKMLLVHVAMTGAGAVVLPSYLKP